MNILFDTNVILDIMIVERANSFPDSKRAAEQIIKGDNNCFVSATAITDIYNILRKAMRSSAQAIGAVKELLKVFPIADVNTQDIDEALKSDMPDFEDGVVDAVAKRHKCDLIITRNTCDFVSSKVPALTPKEWIETRDRI